MIPDEPGQLAIARFLGRGARWNMFDHSTWRPAFGALVSPATWFTDDPVAMYRAAIGVNAVLGGVSCVLLAVLAARLTGLSRAACAVLAAAVSLAPALLFTTNYVWSEALVQTTFLAFLLAALRFLEHPSLAWGGAMIAAAALGFATHSRLLPLAVVGAAFVVFVMVRRRLRPAAWSCSSCSPCRSTPSPAPRGTSSAGCGRSRRRRTQPAASSAGSGPAARWPYRRPVRSGTSSSPRSASPASARWSSSARRVPARHGPTGRQRC